VDSDPHIVPTMLAAALIVACAVMALLLHVRTRPRRPAAGPATMELGDEPPAVVDLLTDDFVVTPEAVPATLVDLAARRWLTIEDVAGGQVVIRLKARDRDEPLAPFERRVLGHLRQLSVDGVVPASAMTTGPEGASQRWWRGFRDEVVAAAQAEGLSRDRWTRAILLPVWGGVIGAGALLWLALELGTASEGTDSFGRTGRLWVLIALATFTLGLWAFTRLGRGLQRDTDAGLAAASRWVGVREYMASAGNFEDKPAAMVALWDRYLAYAVALDLAPLVVAQLPLGAEDHRHAWSRASGRWRQVLVRYPVMRPGYGQHPALAVLGALLVAVPALLVLRAAVRARRDGIDVLADVTGAAATAVDVGIVLAGVAASLVLVWNAVKLVAALADLVATGEVEGLLIRARVRRGWFGLVEAASTDSDDQTRERFLCALDTGEGAVVVAWRVRRRIYDQVRQGDRYVVRVTRRLRYVHAVTPA